MIAGLAVLLGAGLAAAKPTAEPIPVRIEIGLAEADLLPAATALPTSSHLVVEPVVTEGGPRPDPLELEIEVPGSTVVELVAGIEWRVRLLDDRFWHRPSTWEVDQGQGDGPGATKALAAQAVEVRPASWISFRLRPESKSPIPEQVDLRIAPERAAGTGASAAATRQSCRVIEAEARCKLPAGTNDLRIAARGFVPQYWFGLAIPHGKTRRLGTLSLQRGASLVGWLESPGPRVDLSAARVELALHTSAQMTASQRQQLAASRRETQADARGFFQLSGLLPGAYLLTADHPEYAPTSLELTLPADEEVELEPLALRRAAEVEISIRYPTDPFRQPWRLSLEGEALRNQAEPTRFEAEASPEGELAFAGLPPGSYWLTVHDSRGSRWHAETIELFEGPSRHEVEVRFERLHGKVTLADEPVDGARVEIREHEGSSHYVLETREGGNFYAFLRAASIWNVHIRHRQQKISATFPRVIVPEKEDDRPYPYREFPIPDTRVFGEIVEADGAPAEGEFQVDGRHENGELLRAFAEGHEFEIRGSVPGELFLEARTDRSMVRRDARSARTGVLLHEGGEVGPVRLVVEDEVAVHGVVVGPDGAGVAGTRVIGLEETADGQYLAGHVLDQATDLDGVFEMKVRANASAVQLTFFPPGFALQQHRVPLHPEPEPLIVPLHTSAGALVVRYQEPPALWREAPGYLARYTTVFAPFPIVGHFLQEHSRLGSQETPSHPTWRIRDLPPGPVWACFGLDFGRVAPARLDTPSPAHCVEGQLAPGSTLTLTLPSELLEREYALGVEREAALAGVGNTAESP